MAAAAGGRIPPCMANGKVLPVDNTTPIQWKKTQPNQFRARAYIGGRVSRVFADATGHDHFEIQIGPNRGDVVEVIYNAEFGALPDINVGMNVLACGDFITATAQSGPYPPSPSGAIIHWVHMNPNGRGHDHGFVVVDNVLYGWDASQADRRDNGKNKKHEIAPESEALEAALAY